jgi:hypothetical protein
VSDSSDAANRATALVEGLVERSGSYHDHKETMAYAGITLYVAAFGTAILSKDWPPAWGPYTRIKTIVAISVAWILVLRFVKWQLLRRRWAAIRMAGAHRLLARWVAAPPTAKDLETWKKRSGQRPSMVIRLIDHVVPLRRAVLPVDVAQEVYPRALVEAWLEQARDHGSEALFHERWILLIGWLLYFALLIRTANPTG